MGGLELAGGCGWQTRFHAADLAGPAALEDCAALGTLADIRLKVAPVDLLLLLAGPKDQACVRRNDGQRSHALLSCSRLLARDVIELVALAARHLRYGSDREG